MSARTVIHRVSVNASMFAAAPPKRAPVPDAATPPNGHVGLVVDGLVVDVDDAGRDAPGQVESAHHVAGEDAERQAVFAVGGELRGLVDAESNRTTGATGPNTSFAYAGIVGGDVGQHRRPVEQPLVRAAGGEPRTGRRHST